MRNKQVYLSEDVYKKAHTALCIACVDVIVKTPKGVLIGVRNIPPRGMPSLIGGRILFGERPDLAVIRKVREETGLKVKVEKLVGVYSRGFTEGTVRYNIVLAYLARQVGGKLKLTREYSKYIFIKKMPKGLHPYVRRVLTDGRVFGGKAAKKDPVKIPHFFN